MISTIIAKHLQVLLLTIHQMYVGVFASTFSSYSLSLSLTKLCFLLLQKYHVDKYNIVHIHIKTIINRYSFIHEFNKHFYVWRILDHSEEM